MVKSIYHPLFRRLSCPSFSGSQHGSHAEKGFVFEGPAKMKIGTNHISLLCMTVGLPVSLMDDVITEIEFETGTHCVFSLSMKDSGAYMEHRYAGPRTVTILGLNTGTIDVSQNGWGHRVSVIKFPTFENIRTTFK